MDPFLAWLEQTGFSVWARESPSLLAFPTLLILHAVGMGFLVGTNVALDLRVLGLARGIPLAPMARFFPVMWFGLGVNTVSGVALLIAYPTKALTNPVFYFKMACIGAALVFLSRIRGALFSGGGESGEALPSKVKRWAAASLVLWVSAITAGRLLAYTYSRLLVDE